jgi:hypothetical protein
MLKLKSNNVNKDNMLKLKYIKYFFIVFSIIMTLAVMAFSVFSAESEFEKWKNSQMNSLNKYKDQIDGDFIKHLESQWKEFSVYSGLVRDKSPKPKKVPVAPSEPEEPVSETPEKIIEKTPAPEYVPIKKPAIKPAITPIVEKGKKLAFSFYKIPIVLYFDPDFQIERLQRINKKAISSFWDKMSQTDYKPFIKQLGMYKKNLMLNDWGYHYLLHRAGMKIFYGDINRTRLFTWFISSKSGFKSKIGYDDIIYLLAPSKNSLYSIPYLVEEKEKYYSIFFDKPHEQFASIYTYEGGYPNAEKVIDYSILHTPAIKAFIEKRDIKFKFKGEVFSFSIEYDKNLVEFFKYYPQSDLKIYFIADISANTKQNLIKNLKPLIEGRNIEDAVNFLLRFVQTAFPYKTDDDQFGREKYLFIEETLYYPYSDCEDRSFLFAWLVKNLLDFDVVGLDYPGHVAVAVEMGEKIKGDYIINKNKKYIICDPTYINANAGMAMPNLKNVPSNIIFFN